jgi:hypothetical protein
MDSGTCRMEISMTGNDGPSPRASSPFWRDRSLWVLFLSNLFTGIMAVMENWRIGDLIWVYWGQSVIIGIFNVKRMLALRTFSVDGLKLNGKPVTADRKTQVSMAAFFSIHYGFFHLAYLFFLASGIMASSPKQSWIENGLCLTAFLAHHAFSFRRNVERDTAGKPNIGTLMFFPYARIIPMHVTLIFGGLFSKESTGLLVFFLSLKSAADMAMHAVEHRVLSAPARPSQEKIPKNFFRGRNANE